MTVTSHVSSPTQAAGQQREDKFAKGGQEAMPASRVSELIAGLRNHHYTLIFHSRGRLFAEIELHFSSS